MKNKKLKPGQVCCINRKIYRAYKRTDGCSGCFWENDVFSCPGIFNIKTGETQIECSLSNIVLKHEQKI